VPCRAKTRTYTAAYKARILAEYEDLDKAGKGALLRREGLYTSLISAWRQQRDQGALAALAKPAGRPQADPRDRENTQLRKENERLQAELDVEGARLRLPVHRGEGAEDAEVLRVTASQRGTLTYTREQMKEPLHLYL